MSKPCDECEGRGFNTWTCDRHVETYKCPACKGTGLTQENPPSPAKAADMTELESQLIDAMVDSATAAIKHRIAQDHDAVAIWEPRPCPPDWTPHER